MNVTGRLGATRGGARSVGVPLPFSARDVARVLTRAFIVVLLFVLAGAAGLGLYASAHAGRVYEGISVAGVSIGGLPPSEARGSLERHFAAYATTPLTLTAGEQTFQLTPREAGAILDSAATVEAAMAWGREGSLWDQSRAVARALVRGVTVAPVVALDPATARGSLAAFAPDVVRPAVDATLAFNPSGHPEIVPDVTGVRLDYAATESELAVRIAGFASEPVTLVTREDPAGVTAASLAPSLPEAKAAVDAPLLITAGNAVWHVPAEALRPLIGVDLATSQVQIDRRPLTALVADLAAEVDHPAEDAAISVDENGRLAVVPAIAATHVDVEASVAAIAAGLIAGQDEVALVVDETPAQISDAMAAAAVERGEAMMADGIALTWKGGEGLFDRGDFLRALTIRSRPGAEQPFVFGLDANQVWNSLFRYAYEFDIPVQDARWRIIDGKIQLAIPESKGRELDLDRGVAQVMAAFLDGDHEVELGVRTIMPKWKATNGAAITLGDDILAEAGTYYGDSSDSRRQNLELGSSKLSGWLVPPGAVFSFADSVGLIEEETGFVTGYGIVDDGNGGFTTAPVTGGGICQVSTTLYQAAFWAGLPFLERHAASRTTCGTTARRSSACPGSTPWSTSSPTGGSTCASGTRPATGWPSS